MPYKQFSLIIMKKPPRHFVRSADPRFKVNREVLFALRQWDPFSHRLSCNANSFY